MTYGDLKTAIQNYVQTSEATFTGQINDFIRTAEDRVYRSVQMPAFWNSTAVDGIGAQTTITLPAGAIEVYNVRVSKDDGDATGEWTYLLRKCLQESRSITLWGLLGQRVASTQTSRLR